MAEGAASGTRRRHAFQRHRQSMHRQGQDKGRAGGGAAAAAGGGERAARWPCGGPMCACLQLEAAACRQRPPPTPASRPPHLLLQHHLAASQLLLHPQLLGCAAAPHRTHTDPSKRYGLRTRAWRGRGCAVGSKARSSDTGTHTHMRVQRHERTRAAAPRRHARPLLNAAWLTWRSAVNGQRRGDSPCAGSVGTCAAREGAERRRGRKARGGDANAPGRRGLLPLPSCEPC